jgi:exonuclease VII small subunit
MRQSRALSAQPERDDPNAGGIQQSRTDSPGDDSASKSSMKLDIDRPQDFKFHVAYGVYARAWEQNAFEAVRARLNELISSLSKDDSENSYLAFYAGIQQYRKDLTSFSHARTRIQTQRKRDWQRTDTRDRRNRRHK